MSLISVIVALIIIGFILWLVQTLIPMDPKIKTVIVAVVLLVVCLWLLSLFFPGVTHFRVGG